MATQAARVLLHYGFDSVGFTEVIAATDVLNRASVRVMERLGMAHWGMEDAIVYYRSIQQL